MTSVSRITSLFLIIATIAMAQAEEKDVQIRFKRTRLDDKFRSEGSAVGDFNHDGKMDIAAGTVYYTAPDWEMHLLADKAMEYNPKGYSNSFCNFADDVNRDGWTDIIVVDFPGKETWWLENPKKSGVPWKRHVATPVTNNESPQYLDIDGDGQRELLAGVNQTDTNPDGPGREMAIIRLTDDFEKPWKINVISTKESPGAMKYSHGLGMGDINGDGNSDILVAEGWWESPGKKNASNWTFHNAPFGAAAQMYVFDFDGDGDGDVLSSSPHAFGIWWHEQTKDGWKKHLIDKSFSQTHGVILADINSDGLPDFVTGKRWWAHGGNDPGGDQPAVFFWYELTRRGGKPVWIPHQFDHNSGPGTQFEVADVNGDGLLDVVTSNKKGVHYFEQIRD